ncbi:MAG: pilus assembly protein [Lachnospiraceae bacterium]|nr:pilus assembly protein [Lachnospiraceae bacterium]
MRKELKGSYTIEAALIFPMIMTVIVFIIYMSLYLHDRAVMSSCAYQAALKASMIRTAVEDMRKEAEKAADYNLEGLLLATENVESEVEVSGKNVKVSYKGNLRIPHSILFLNIAGTDRIVVEGNGTARQKDAIEFIRSCRAAENIVK